MHAVDVVNWLPAVRSIDGILNCRHHSGSILRCAHNKRHLAAKHRQRHVGKLIKGEVNLRLLASGAVNPMLFHVPDEGLLLYLGFFTGFLLYIGAADILPQANADHPSRLTLLLTVAGTAMIYLVTRVGF